MFDPQEFISFARNFSKEDLGEAEYRSAVSRSLYGVFLWAREELERRGEGVKAKNEDDKPFEHSRVRQCFKRGGHFRHDGASQRLGALYTLRHKSDYDLDASVQHADLIQALEYVDYIDKTFRTTLFANPPHKN